MTNLDSNPTGRPRYASNNQTAWIIGIIVAAVIVCIAYFGWGTHSTVTTPTANQQTTDAPATPAPSPAVTPAKP